MKHRVLILIAQALFLAAVIWVAFSCQKQPQQGTVPASSQQSSLKVKLEVWYQLPDSVQVTPAHPCGTIVPCYTKQNESWYECGTPTGNVHTITAQQTGVDLLLQDSFQFTIYINGAEISKVSGKKLLTASYTY